jgi:hypothetical protein
MASKSKNERGKREKNKTIPLYRHLSVKHATRCINV